MYEYIVSIYIYIYMYRICVYVYIYIYTLISVLYMKHYKTTYRSVSKCPLIGHSLPGPLGQNQSVWCKHLEHTEWYALVYCIYSIFFKPIWLHLTYALEGITLRMFRNWCTLSWLVSLSCKPLLPCMRQM